MTRAAKRRILHPRGHGRFHEALFHSRVSCNQAKPWSLSGPGETYGQFGRLMDIRGGYRSFVTPPRSSALYPCPKAADN